MSSEADNNASAGSESENTDGLGTQFFASVTGLKNFGNEAVGVVTINKGSEDSGFSVHPLSVLPQNGPHMYLPSVLIHELIHAYGMLTDVYGDDEGRYGFGEELIPFEAGLRDVFGNPAAGSKEFNLIRSESGAFTEEFIKTQEEAGQFNLLFRESSGGVSFAGEHVNELIDENVRIYNADTVIVDADGKLVEGDMTNSVVGGIPINGLEIAGNGKDFDIELSHLELQNSFLSHQNWRNWSTLMEAEMAFLQDLGFKFDRKRFFGTSLYDNDKSVDITQAFTQRNEGDWVENTPSTQAFAIGTHIYGSLNTVNVKADQLADGTASIGVRVDGIMNDLTVEEGVKVSANGQGGLGRSLYIRAQPHFDTSRKCCY